MFEVIVTFLFLANPNLGQPVNYVVTSAMDSSSSYIYSAAPLLPPMPDIEARVGSKPSSPFPFLGTCSPSRMVGPVLDGMTAIQCQGN